MCEYMCASFELDGDSGRGVIARREGGLEVGRGWFCASMSGSSCARRGGDSIAY